MFFKKLNRQNLIVNYNIFGILGRSESVYNGCKPIQRENVLD